MGSHSCQALTFQGRFEAALGCLDEAVWGTQWGMGFRMEWHHGDVGNVSRSKKPGGEMFEI